MTDVEVRVLGPGDWRDWRYLRLRALADAPSAFGSTLAREQKFAATEWRQRTTDGVLLYDGGGAGLHGSRLGAGPARSPDGRRDVDRA